MLWTDDAAHNDHEGLVSLPDFRDWKEQSRALVDMTLFGGQTFLLGTDGSPERLRSARVQGNFFPVMGVQPIVGRVFSGEEEKRGERVVVLSYGLWQRLFGGSARAVGADLTMDGRKSRIIGVMPREFQFPFPDTQVWEPITAHPYWARNRNSSRSDAVWRVLARVRRGVGWSQVQSEMNAIARRVAAQQDTGTQGQPGINVVPLPLQTTGKVQLPLAVLFSAVFLLLLIACTNVANLQLVRGAVRAREFAVRRALGASRLRIAGQLLMENLVLAGCGASLGVMLASLALKALIAFGPQGIPRLGEARLNAAVLAFTLLISLFAATVSALWPALQSGTGVTRGRDWTTAANRTIRRFLVAAEFALCLVLLAGASLLMHSFLRLQGVQLGFVPENLLVMRIDLHVGKAPEQQVSYFSQAIERVRKLPGVRSAAATGRFLQAYGPDPVRIEGRIARPDADEASDDLISGPFFETAGIPLKLGRVFSDQDRKGSLPVAVINDTMAKKFWPGGNPIGKKFQFSEEKGSPWFTVVGVVGDMHRQGLEKQVAPQVFRPHSQSPDNEMDLLVRTAGDPLNMAVAVRNEIQSMDKTVAKFNVSTVEEQLGAQTAERRFHTSLIGVFSLLALLLSAVGIYGLIQHLVVQRTHEIGLRMALGARAGSVIALILRQGLTLAGAGVLVGLLAAFAFTRMLSSLLYGVTPTDPLAFTIAPAILLGVAVFACWLPARRAAHIDPLIALRQD